MRDECEARPLGESDACDDRTPNHAGAGEPHGATVAGRCPDRQGLPATRTRHCTHPTLTAAFDSSIGMLTARPAARPRVSCATRGFRRVTRSVTIAPGVIAQAGRHPYLSLADARAKAKRAISDVVHGGDPAAAKQTERRQRPSRTSSPSIWRSTPRCASEAGVRISE